MREIAEWVGYVSRPALKYWAWEIGRRDRSHVCSIRTTSAIVKILYSSIWRSLRAIRRCFCVVSLRTTKHGSTGTHQRQTNSQNSGLHSANRLLRRQNCPIDRKGWPTFSGIDKMWSTSNTFRRPNYWADFTPNGKENNPIWWRKTCSSSMTTHRLTLRPNYSFSTAPGGFHLLPNVKRSLAGQKFESNEEVIAVKKAFFSDIQKMYLWSRLRQCGNPGSSVSG